MTLLFAALFALIIGAALSLAASSRPQLASGIGAGSAIIASVLGLAFSISLLAAPPSSLRIAKEILFHVKSRPTGIQFDLTRFR